MSKTKMAAPELAAVEVHGMTREAFLARGAIAAGTVYGLATVGPFVREAIAQEGGGDLEILNFALTLEYLEAAFYKMALKQVNGLGGEAKEIATTIHERRGRARDALTSTIKELGGTPVKAPGVDFGEAFASQSSFLETAQTFEDLGVGAYNGAGPMIESKEVLAAAGSIVQVEGRHAGDRSACFAVSRSAPARSTRASACKRSWTPAKPFIKA